MGVKSKMDIDDLNQDEQGELFSAVSEIFDVPLYDRHVEHGYSVDYVSTTEKCPRCNAKTNQYYANWIYATQIAPRVMFAPAGYFCTECPAVIVDESMIQSAINPKFQFLGILGIDSGQEEEGPDLFRTWNGVEAVYVLDENQTPMGISTIDSVESPAFVSRNPSPPRKKKSKNQAKRRRRLAKQSRKRNRRKK